MVVIELHSKSVEETLLIGQVLGERAEPGTVIALIGNLGAGKTTFTQGIAAGLMVPLDYYVTSPTFTLLNEYPGRMPLYHVDVYRLAGSSDLDDIGYEEYIAGDGLVAVEWADKVADRLPGGTVVVRMDCLDADAERRIEISCSFDERLRKIRNGLKEGGFV